MEIESLVLELVMKVVVKAVGSHVSFAVEAFFVKRRIESRIEETVAQAVEPIVPFLRLESTSEDDIHLLFEVCSRELQTLLQTPEKFFEGSLDGQKVFDQTYAARPLPEELGSGALRHMYTLVFPRIGNLICGIPPLIKQWSIIGYKENFRRMDEFGITLGEMNGKLDARPQYAINEDMQLLEMIRQGLLQRVDFQIDLTGLRGDRPDAVPLEKLFIVPSVEWNKEGLRNDAMTLTREAMLAVFSSMKSPGVLIGGPGSGKSTFCQWLQRSLLAKQGSPVCFLFRLRELSRRETLPPILDLIKEAAGVHIKDEIDAKTLRQWTRHGAVMVILDGFDEVPPTRRSDMLAWVERLAGAVHPASVLVSTRPLSTSHLDALAYRFAILPFDEARVRDYATRWYAHAPLLSEEQRRIDAGALAGTWCSDPVLNPLVRVPLTLATVLMVHHIDGALPSGRSKLYERYVDGMLGLWDGRWGVVATLTLSMQEKRRVLMDIAIHFHTNSIEEVPDTDLLPVLQASLKAVGSSERPEAVRDHLRERSGLLIGPGTWSFVHKSVGEYLVAAAISEGDRYAADGTRFDRLTLFGERHNDRWNAVLFFWAGLANAGDLQRFIEEIVGDATDGSDCALAAGLMLDQALGHRLPIDWRADRVRRLLGCVQLFVSARSGLAGVTPIDLTDGTDLCLENIPSEQSMTVPLHSRTIRSMANTRDTFALQRLTSSARLSWDVVRTLVPAEGRAEMWIQFLRNPLSVDDLRLLLQEIAPGGTVPARFVAFVLHHLATRAFAADGTTIHGDTYLEAVEEQIPALRSQTALLLMASLLSDAVAASPAISGASPAHRIAEAVLERAGQPVDAGVLAKTWGWRRENADKFVESKRDIDLLSVLERFFEPPDIGRERSQQRTAASQRRFLSADVSDLRASDPLDGLVAGEPLADMRARLLDLVKKWQRQRAQPIALSP